MQHAYRANLPARQKGATLVIALLILVLIMMVGITAVSTSNTQFKLAGNLQFEDSAMNNAETAVTAAENWLASGANFSNAAFTAVAPSTDPDPGSNVATPELLPLTSVALIRTARATAPLNASWGSTNSRCVGDSDLATGACDAPGGNPSQRYLIELMSLNNRLQGSSQVVGGRSSSGCNQVNTYQITGRGVSARGATKFVQSFYSVLNCPA